MKKIQAYFKENKWTVKPFQRQAWQAWNAGKQGIISVPTGSGKTFAAVAAPIELMGEEAGSGLKILYITPLKALAEDLARSIRPFLQHCHPKAQLEIRTGDTSSYRKQKLKSKMPDVLITTPESLALILSYEGMSDRFSELSTIIVDEWHELMASKRGALLSLNLECIRNLRPEVRTWGLSATVKDPEVAAKYLLGGRDSEIIRSKNKKKIKLQRIVPAGSRGLGWSGHLGLRGLDALSKDLDWSSSNIIFTNTRNQAEIWYKALIEKFPDNLSLIGLHHSSIGAEERLQCEEGLKTGEIKVAVCTSSLELGLDFSFVDVIYQIGSPKSVARTVQRAGRSGHRPGAASEIRIVPTNVLELFELRAIENAIGKEEVESVIHIDNPLDVMLQHLSNRSLGDGFSSEEMHQEIISSYFFKQVKKEDIDWALDFLSTGGASLKAYEQHRKIIRQDGRFKISNPRVGQLQRMNMGTIVSDLSINVKFVRGKSLGRVEERYISRLSPGEVFYLGGRPLELVKFYQNDAIVKPAKAKGANHPRWVGGRLGNTPILSKFLRDSFSEPIDKSKKSHRIMDQFISAQQLHSIVPDQNQFLLEVWAQKRGTHLFAYPIRGRHANHSIGLILAYRLSKKLAATYSLVVSEYGVEIVINDNSKIEALLTPELLSPTGWSDDLKMAINMSELSKLHFREIARVSNLVWQNYPRARKRGSEIKASASLLHGVFSQFEPENPLLEQADREVLERELDYKNTGGILKEIQSLTWVVKSLPTPSPLGINLIGERLAAKLSSESTKERIDKLVAYYEQ
ncbi:ligase-associated DNA damage response DEXH box helicase [Oligoflexaceae bacterium]|nr:ligase-associated DNA damage response DEXH box helicase [Oligoflexaceae bacterium]